MLIVHSMQRSVNEEARRIPFVSKTAAFNGNIYSSNKLHIRHWLNSAREIRMILNLR